MRTTVLDSGLLVITRVIRGAAWVPEVEGTDPAARLSTAVRAGGDVEGATTPPEGAARPPPPLDSGGPPVMGAVGDIPLVLSWMPLVGVVGEDEVREAAPSREAGTGVRLREA